VAVWRLETEFSDQELANLVIESGLEPQYVYGYGSFFLAAVRHTLLPKLDFGMLWRNGTEFDVIRAIKAKIALEICVVGKKGSKGAIAPASVEEGTEGPR
jgi:hypothetical protein